MKTWESEREKILKQLNVPDVRKGTLPKIVGWVILIGFAALIYFSRG